MVERTRQRISLLIYDGLGWKYIKLQSFYDFTTFLSFINIYEYVI